ARLRAVESTRLSVRSLSQRGAWRTGCLFQGIRQVPFGVISRAHALYDLRHRTLQDAEVGLRVQADPEGPDHQRSEDRDFAPGKILQTRVPLLHFAQHRALEQP